jgi:ABC-type dipeptide/oligopeptide/nickel transport system permease subunit
MRSFLRRFAKNKLAVVGLCFIVLLVLAAIFAPLITPYGYKERTPELRVGPSWDHWFGTDNLGYDVYTRVVYGARVSLKIGISATAIALLIGVTFGAISGFFGGRTDSLMMRTVDIFLSIPSPTSSSPSRSPRCSGRARTR